MLKLEKCAVAALTILALAATPAIAESTKGVAKSDEAPVAFPSKDILSREQVTDSADVKHVLVAWKDLASAYGGRIDERALSRTKAEADALVAEILKQARAGEDFDTLMKKYSEDPGSANTGRSYTATVEARLVPPFKALSLRLNVDEVGLVKTKYGWHVIKRTQ